MFKAVTHPAGFSGQAPANAAKPTARMILSRVISDDISAEKKSKWQRAKYHALVRLIAVSNHHIGTLDLPHLVINQVTLPQKFNLTGANLRRSEFKQVTMTAVNLSQSDLSHATLYYTQLENAHLEGADLRHANLSQALGHAVLNYAKLQNAYFNLTNLYCAKLRYVDLSGAHLKNVDLSGACLRHANLRNADLRSANLRGTCLNNADLSGAKLNPDSMSDINFKGAIIERAIKLDLSAGWSRYAIDNYFNAGDRPGGGILQAIDSINAVYPSLKIALVRQIMLSLQQTTHHPCRQAVGIAYKVETNASGREPTCIANIAIGFLIQKSKGYCCHDTVASQVPRSYLSFLRSLVHTGRVFIGIAGWTGTSGPA